MTHDLPMRISDAERVLALLGEMTDEDAGRTYQEIAAIRTSFREWCRIADEAFVERFAGKNIPVQTASGERRLYVANDKRTKCPNKTAALLAIVEAVGGDLDQVANTLSSDAFKPGACKVVLGQRYDECFVTEEVPDIKTGSPKRIVRQTQEEQ